MLSQPHAVKLCHLPLKVKGTHGCNSNTTKNSWNVGKPLTKLSAKGGFEQNTCFRRTGIKSSYKVKKLLEIAGKFWQAKVDRKVILCRNRLIWGGKWSYCITAHRSHFLIQCRSHEQDRDQWPELPKRYWQKSEEVNRWTPKHLWLFVCS